jgi:hypothetical protein
MFLVSVGTVSAECAWVLWITRDTGDTPQQPVVYASYATIADCIKTLDHEERAARVAAANSATRVAPRSLTIDRLGSLWARSFRCLPDTVDPRGREGR